MHARTILTSTSLVIFLNTKLLVQWSHLTFKITHFKSHIRNVIQPFLGQARPIITCKCSPETSQTGTLSQCSHTHRPEPKSPVQYRLLQIHVVRLTKEENASWGSLAWRMLPRDARLATSLAVAFSHYAHVQIVNEVSHVTWRATTAPLQSASRPLPRPLRRGQMQGNLQADAVEGGWGGGSGKQTPIGLRLHYVKAEEPSLKPYEW